MEPFDGAKHFGFIAFVAFSSALVCSPYIGCWGWVPAVLTVYFALVLYNRLEERDLRDFSVPERMRSRRN